MCGVIVVDAESFRSTWHKHDAYIHDHCLDILITMRSSINCSAVICSPTVILMLSWEKPLVKPMAPGSIFHHIIFLSTCYFYFVIFIFQSIQQKYQKYLSYYLYQISLLQVAVKGLACGLLLDWYLGSQKLREILTLLCCITLSSSRENQHMLKR